MCIKLGKNVNFVLMKEYTKIARIAIFLAAAITAALFFGCGSRGKQTAGSERQTISVSIPPLYGLVEAIVGDDYNIEIILPEGTSPETFSPTFSQIAAVSNSEMVFVTGLLDYERAIADRLVQHTENQFINTSKGAHLIEGSCTHNHSEDVEHTHSHGVDPHAWMSPFELEIIARNIGDAICSKHSYNKLYIANFEQLMLKIKERQITYQALINNANNTTFLIYHPALSYLARDYGLTQISLENEGKSPTPTALAAIVDIVNKQHISSMMYQREYPIEVIKPLIDILGVNAMEINPLNKDIISELDRIVNIICAQ